MRICIIYSPTGGGHRVASHALATAISTTSPTTTVDVLDVLDYAPRTFRYDRLWHATQHHGARIYDWVFDATDRPPPLLLAARGRLNRWILGRLVAELERTQPEHIVCTHFLPAVAAAYLRTAGRLRGTLSVVITDYLAHAAWLLPGVDRYYVASPAVAEQLRARGIRDACVTGIPIAPEMDDRYLPPPGAYAPRVLVLAGGVPWPLVRAAVRSLPRALDVELVAGGDARLRSRLVAELPDRRVHGFVPGLRGLIDRADVVVTKAGGLIVSECLARGRAMVLPWPAPGHERGNRAHAVAARAAHAVSDPGRLGAALATLPWLAMGHAAARVATRNAAARIAIDLTGACGEARYKIASGSR